MVIWKLEQKYIVVNLVEKYIVKDVAQHHTALIVTHLQTASGLQVLVNISKATLFGSPFVVLIFCYKEFREIREVKEVRDISKRNR